MAILTHDYFCSKICMATELRVVMPDCYLSNDTPKKTLLLLSPEGESGLGFYEKGDISSICSEYSICAMLIPSLEGCYTDMKLGYPFFSSLKFVREYIQQYLPGKVFCYWRNLQWKPCVFPPNWTSCPQFQRRIPS